MNRVFQSSLCQLIHLSRRSVISGNGGPCLRLLHFDLSHGRFVPVASVFSSNIHTSSIAEAEEKENPDNQQDEQQQEYDKGDGGGKGKKESVIDRIRRLSMTPADEYELSEAAQEKAREMALKRKERGEEWTLDQRNLRPGVQQQQRMGNDWYGEERYGYDRYGRDYDRGSTDRYGRGGNDRDYGRNRFNMDRFDGERDFRGGGDHRSAGNRRRSWRDYEEDEEDSGNFGRRSAAGYEDDRDVDKPEDYEVEMQKLRERLNEQKAQKASKGSSEAGKVESDMTRSQPHFQSISHHEKSSSYRGERQSSLEMGEFGSLSRDRDRRPPSLKQEDFVNLNVAADDPDSFGTLTVGPALVKDHVGAAIQKELQEEAKANSPIADVEEEEDDSRFIPPPGSGQRWSTPKLVTTVRGLLEEKKLKEAVDLYLNVLREGGFHFDKDEIRHHFNVLIHECGQVGYVEMAFRLYRMMKARGYTGNHHTVTSLFNGIANSSGNKEKNLDRIELLLISERENGFEPNMISYHALIKAYGRLGETLRAFGAVDDMIQIARLQPDTTTFNMLLQACISDTKNGFRHALITWKKMQAMNIRPDIYSYNLLLRVVRDCGIEIKSDKNTLIEQPAQGLLEAGSLSLPVLPPVITEEDSNSLLSLLCSENPSESDTQLTLDKLQFPVNSKKLGEALSNCQNRLAVLGGLRGVLSQMVRNKVPPNLKTLTGLVAVTPTSEINDILQLLKVYKIKPDAHFFNNAIKACYLSKFSNFAKDMLQLMTLHHVTPNIDTWAALAVGCRLWVHAKKLLAEMEEANFTPNIYVMGSLLGAATRNYDPRYVLHVIEETKRRDIAVNEFFITRLEQFKDQTQKGLVSKEMGKPVEIVQLAAELEANENFAEHFALFKIRYTEWQKSVDIKILPENPWKEQYKTFRKYGRHTPPESDAQNHDELLSDKTQTVIN